MITSYDFASGKWLTGAADRLPAHDLYFGTPMNRPTAGIPIGDGDTVINKVQSLLVVQGHTCEQIIFTVGIENLVMTCRSKSNKL